MFLGISFGRPQVSNIQRRFIPLRHGAENAQSSVTPLREAAGANLPVGSFARMRETSTPKFGRMRLRVACLVPLALTAEVRLQDELSKNQNQVGKVLRLGGYYGLVIL